jgi:hypothetical protein
MRFTAPWTKLCTLAETSYYLMQLLTFLIEKLTWSSWNFLRVKPWTGVYCITTSSSSSAFNLKYINYISWKVFVEVSLSYPLFHMFIFMWATYDTMYHLLLHAVSLTNLFWSCKIMTVLERLHHLLLLVACRIDSDIFCGLTNKSHKMTTGL